MDVWYATFDPYSDRVVAVNIIICEHPSSCVEQWPPPRSRRGHRPFGSRYSPRCCRRCRIVLLFAHNHCSCGCRYGSFSSTAPCSHPVTIVCTPAAAANAADDMGGHLARAYCSRLVDVGFAFTLSSSWVSAESGAECTVGFIRAFADWRSHSWSGYGAPDPHSVCSV